MINYEYLTSNQLDALKVMADFHCEGIPCEKCPLYNLEHGCGSQRAGNIIDQYYKETKQ